MSTNYHHAYPAPLKNALDYLHNEWHDKPVGFVSYGGISAGLRAVQDIKPVLTALKMAPVTAAVSIHLRSAFDDAGNYVPAFGSDDAATLMFDELARVAKTVIPVRRELATA